MTMWPTRRLSLAVLAATTVGAVLSFNSLAVATAAVNPAPAAQSPATTVVVHWGTHVDAAQAAAAAGVLDAADNSGYLRGLAAEYNVPSHVTYAGAGVVPDSDLPQATTDDSIASTLDEEIAAGVIPAPAGPTAYVVLLPPGTTPDTADASPPFCSSHHPFSAGSTSLQAVVLADYTDRLSSCGNGAGDVRGAVSTNLSRQLVDTLTDPAADGSGVTRAVGSAEVGDACSDAPGLGNVDGYPVQSWWSNKAGACTFGTTGISLVADVATITSAADATFLLHDTQANATAPDFGCTLDDASTSCGTTRPVALSGLGAGSHTLTAQLAGVGSTTFTWIVDRTAPTATLLGPTAPVTVGKTITVRFAGKDTGGAGVSAYDVRYRTSSWNHGFGAWQQPGAWQGTPATRVLLPAAPGHTYCFSVRAHDRAENVSPFWSSTRCTVVPVDDRTLTTKGGWKRIKSTPAFRGTLSTSATAGATLKLVKAHVRQLAVVVRTCATCGRIAVYRGGVLWRTVNTHSATTHNRVLISLRAIGLRTTTIRLQVVGAHKPVYLDGVAVLPV